jgi:MtN3 and saliva related transmembrane protein
LELEKREKYNELMIEIVGFVAAFFSVFAAVPQLAKTIRTRSADDLSAGFFSMLVAGCILWLWYGIAIESRPLVFTNATALSFYVIILILKLKYSNFGHKSQPASQQVETPEAANQGYLACLASIFTRYK